MAEHFLDDAQIGAVAEQVGGKTVSQKMRVDIGFNPRAFRVFLYDLPNANGGEFSAA